MRFSPSAREAALQHAELRCAEGASLLASAREMGVSYMTLRRWRSEVGMHAAFRPVSVIEPPESARRLLVTLPCGLRVEGPDIDGVAHLAQRLR